jgi:hypothetical protein
MRPSWKSFLSSLALRALALCLATFAAWPANAFAGGGPEGLFLVVNSRSWASLSVANHFIALRGLPPSHVLHLDWEGNNERVELATFRERLLAPVLEAIEDRGLEGQIDCVAWSSDFPWSIGVASERVQVLPRQYGDHASLTSLTFFATLVMKGDPNFAGERANRYYSRPADDDLHNAPTSRAFHRWHGWNADGGRNEAGGQEYLLSTMLAPTSGEGVSTSEAVEYLTRAAQADGDQAGGAGVDGAFYFIKNTDVRSTTRDPYFAAAAAAISELGKRTVIEDGTLPMGKTDVLGAMLGAANFHWKSSRSKIVPGAICDHLTSFGGMFADGNSQTTLTELLRHGAAGASGTVEEPFAIQAKFPTAWLHLHYARGCSLAESFYQAVEWPFQLLIVGDPLCQPHAFIPRVTLASEPPVAPWTGQVTLEPRLEGTGEREVDRWEWYVDGLRRGKGAAGDSLSIDSTRLADGFHELRIVAVESGPIATRGWLSLPFVVKNVDREATLERVPAERPATWGEPIEFRVAAPGATRAELLHGRRVVAQISLVEGRGATSLDPRIFGSGPVSLDARVYAAEKASSERRPAPADAWSSAPLRFEVNAAPPLPAQGDAASNLVPGLRLSWGDGSTATIERTVDDWLQDAGVGPDEAYQLNAEFDVPENDVYQFQCQHRGKLVVKVDDRTIYANDEGKGEVVYSPVALEAGRHVLAIEGARAGESPVDLRFGSRGVRRLHADLFVHAE